MKPAPPKPTPTEEDPRWAAVEARDSSVDGTFFYAVTTTGVYCHVSCASRAARPENVRFFETGRDAEAAGFRACRRCKPSEPAPAERRAQQVAKLCRFIERQDEIPTLAQLAAFGGLSPSHLHRMFKQCTGITPRAYGVRQRSQRMRDALGTTSSVTEAIYTAGYGSSSRFYEKSESILGMTATEFVAGGAALPIRFAVGQCSLGAILVAATARGLCAIYLGDDPEALIHDLERQFPTAELVGADPAFETWIARVVGLVEAPSVGLELPLDIRGTAFQQRVWRALRDIPPGQTVSYGVLAEAIGKPKAFRAVASACAANTLAVAIPCHRVVRKDGSLSGYRWGVERKRSLLEREDLSIRRDG